MCITEIERDISSLTLWPKTKYSKLEALIYLKVKIAKRKTLITISSLAKKFSWSRHKTRDFLKELVKIDSISISKLGSEIHINNVSFETKKDIQKDSKKDTVKTDKSNHIEECKDIKKDMEKDTHKNNDIILPISKDSMLEILNI